MLSGWLIVLLSAASDEYTPFVAPASNEGQAAIQGFKVASGHQVSLAAAEPMLANPVVFAIDHRGRFYIAETFRLHSGVTDTRGHMYWVEDDLACRTVADRVAMYKKHLGSALAGYSGEHDRIRLLEDRNGDGKIDRSVVFADGFKNLPDGIGAGVLPIGSDVYWSCIPDLWKLRDTDGDGTVDRRESLHTGYGVHVGFLGHDLHGLKRGPDGRIYFSIGDRGLNVRTKEGKTLDFPDTGCVLRCELDGSQLQIFASGLRNPQELAFDEFGNWFTCDNNSDSGDKARWLQLVEGGDYGWRIGNQFHDEPTPRGPWNNEMLWKPDVTERAAYLLPPIQNFSDGPSGLTYHPGVSRLDDRFKGCFLLCDFRGAASTSGIRTVKLKPKGAGFEIASDGELIWRVLATDCDFGPDGALYFTDWVDGWAKPGKGRLYRLESLAKSSDRLVAETAKLLHTGVGSLPSERLVELLSHADQRVRFEAQFALAEKKSAPQLRSAALAGPLLGRIHALWGLGQLLRAGFEGSDVRATLAVALRDTDPEIRRQAAIVLGDSSAPATPASMRTDLMRLLDDDQPKVLAAAAIALGALGPNNAAVDALASLIKRNADRDPILRHATVMGLVGAASPETLAPLAASTHRSHRLAAVLVLRRWGHPAVGDLVADSDPLVAIEAARAVNDVPVQGAFEKLAAVAGNPVHWSDPYLRRVINANFRLGTADNAKRMAQLAGQSRTPNTIRTEIAFQLGSWSNPPARDRVVGLYRPLPKRDESIAAGVLASQLSVILKNTKSINDDARIAWLDAAGKLKCKAVCPELRALAENKSQASKVRAAALRCLGEIGDRELLQAVKASIADQSADVRAEARRQLAKLSPSEAAPALAQALRDGSKDERQAALAALGGVATPEAAAILTDAFDQMLTGRWPADASLDLYEASKATKSDKLAAKIREWDGRRKANEPLAAFTECLEGGDAVRGRDIFRRKPEVYCLRCHRVGSAGGEVGPNLTEIAKQKNRQYLLESIVDPNRTIAQGFETVLLLMEDGTTLTGVLKSEDDKELKLMSADGKVIVAPKSSIEVRKRGPSAMPQDAMKHLSKRELRDLIEYLTVQPK